MLLQRLSSTKEYRYVGSIKSPRILWCHTTDLQNDDRKIYFYRCYGTLVESKRKLASTMKDQIHIGTSIWKCVAVRCVLHYFLIDLKQWDVLVYRYYHHSSVVISELLDMIFVVGVGVVSTTTEYLYRQRSGIVLFRILLLLELGGTFR